MTNEARRLRVIRDLKIAGTRAASSFHSIVELAAELCDAPIAAITVIDRDTRWFYATVGLNLASTPRKRSLCERVVVGGEPVIAEDLTTDRRAVDEPIINVEKGLGAYLGVPITYNSGMRIGTLAVFDTRPRAFNAEQIERVQRLAGFVVEALRLQEIVLSQQDYLLQAHEAKAVIETKNADLERAKSEMDLAAEVAEVGFWSMDLDTLEADLSPSLQRMLGVTDTMGLEAVRARLPQEDWDLWVEQFERCRQGETRFELKWRALVGGVDGRQEKWFRSVGRTEFVDGAAKRIYGASQDITSAVRNRRHISRLAALDMLTGVQNRRLLPLAYMKLRRDNDFDQRKLTLMLVDVDHFKLVNDTKGHDVGDEVLVKITEILRNSLREGDVVGRLGGDEFMMIVRADHGLDIGEIISERLAATVERDPLLSGFSTPVTLSIGYVDVNSDNIAFADTLKYADLAVYEAKRRGRACAVRYEAALGDASNRRAQVLHQIDAALRDGLVVPAYQAKVDLGSGSLVGFEALARWRHPERGLLPPAAFIEALEHPIYSARISEAVLESAIADLRRFLDLGLDIGRIAVNVAESQLADESFPDRIQELCERYGAPAERLEIEVTEKILLTRRAELIRETIRRVADRGVTVAFDDFGTGYASLTHLREFDIDVIKIDRSFVKNLVADAPTQAITSSVIQMANGLGLGVVAEGVETEEDATLLREMGCPMGQGFLFSKGVIFDEAAALATRWRDEASTRATLSA